MHGLRWLGHVLDSLVYMFSPVLCCFLIRILQVSPLVSTCSKLGCMFVIKYDYALQDVACGCIAKWCTAKLCQSFCRIKVHMACRGVLCWHVLGGALCSFWTFHTCTSCWRRMSASCLPSAMPWPQWTFTALTQQIILCIASHTGEPSAVW